MADKSNRYGIGMMDYAKEHEVYIKEKLSGNFDKTELLDYHNMKIQWLQHERLIHLLVTFLVAIVFLFLFGLLMFFTEDILILVPLVIITCLFAAYIFHYFKLENTVQRWYKLYDEIDKKGNG